jgi:hypothetical protein
MSEIIDVPLAEGPLPEQDPRSWMSQEVLDSGTEPLPTVVIAGGAERKLVAVELEPDAAWIASVDAALLARQDVDWVGGWGTALLKRDGGRVMASFARMRHVDGTVWLRLWMRFPGVAPSEEDAETWEGPLESLPLWLQRLFPAPRGLRIRLVEATLESLRPARAPDDVLPLWEGATFADFTLTAAHRLEARVVHTGLVGPSVVAWVGNELRVWWGEHLDEMEQIGRNVAQKADTHAIGLFGLGEDDEEDGHMLALAAESRAEQQLMWVRRFSIGRDGSASWSQESGELKPGRPTLGWFTVKVA